MTLKEAFLARQSAFDSLPLRRRLLWRAASFLGVFGVVVPLFWNVSGFGPAARGAQAAYDRIEASGAPLSADGFMRSFAVPDSQNCFKEAFPASQRILKAVNPEHYDSSIEGKIRNGWLVSSTDPVPSVSVFERVLRPFANDLATIKVALRKPYFVAPEDWVSPSAVTSKGGGMYAAKDLLSTRAWTMARMGRRTEALSDMRDVIRITNAMAHMPSSLRYINLSSNIRRNIEEVLRCVQADPGGANEYRKLLNFAPMPSILKCLRADVYIDLAEVRDQGTWELFESRWEYETIISSSPKVRSTRQRSGLPRDPIVRALVGRMLEKSESLLQAFDREGREVSPGAFRAAVRKVRRLAETQSGVLNYLASYTGNYAQDISLAEARRASTLSTVRSLIDVVDFHNLHNRWPTSLDELAGDHSDPYSPSEQLCYRVTDKDVRVWSRGKDGADDGGLTSAERSAAKVNYKKQDIVFTFNLVSTDSSDNP